MVLPVAGLPLITVIGLTCWLFSSIISDQLGELQQTLPAAWDDFKEWLNGFAAGRYALSQANEFSFGDGVAKRFSVAAFSAFGGITNLVLVVAGGSIWLCNRNYTGKGFLGWCRNPCGQRPMKPSPSPVASSGFSCLAKCYR